MTTTDPIWDGYVPPRIDMTGPKPAEERMPIFYVTVPGAVEGQTEEKAYTAPRRVSARTAIRAIRTVALQGPEAATWLMLEESLEPEALKVLTDSEWVLYDQAQMVLQQLGRLYYGQMKEMKDPEGK